MQTFLPKNVRSATLSILLVGASKELPRISHVNIAFVISSKADLGSVEC